MSKSNIIAIVLSAIILFACGLFAGQQCEKWNDMNTAHYIYDENTDEIYIGYVGDDDMIYLG